MSTEPPQAPEAEAPDPRRFTLAIVGAVGTGISGIGFFIFVGGAMILGRFRGAGLPALSALSVAPRSQLLALGAASLMILLVLGIAIAVVLATIWPRLGSRWQRVGTLTVLGLIGLVLYLQRVDVRHLDDPEHALLLLAGVLVVTAGIAVTYRLGERGLDIARTTGDPARLVWFVIAAFGTTALFSALGAYVRQLNHPEVQAGALLQASGRPPIVGLFVGETGGQNSPNPNRVYIGSVFSGHHPGASRTGRLIAVPSPSVTGLAIGPAEPVDAALARAPRLLQELERAERPRSQGSPPPG